MKWLAIAVIGSLTACSGGSGSSSSPTAPTAPPANIAAQYSTTITAASTCSANVPFPLLGFLATVTQTGCGGPGGTPGPCARFANGHRLWHGLWPGGQLSELPVDRSNGTRRDARCIGHGQRRYRRTKDHRHPQRHIPDAIGIDLQCNEPSTRDGQAMLAADLQHGTPTGSMCMMRKAQILWLGATTVAIGMPAADAADAAGTPRHLERFEEAVRRALTNRVRRRAAIWHAASPLMAGWICPDRTKRPRGMSHRSRDSHLPLAATFPLRNRRHESGCPVRA